MAGTTMSGIALLTIALALGPWVDAPQSSSELRWNQIQVIGTHNSYHIAPAPEVMKLIAIAGADRAKGLDYTHPPLAEQFDRLGIRQIELDLYADPQGGLFAEPSARKSLQTLGRDPGPAPDPALRGLGLKVLHVPDIDFQTRTPTFVDALRQVRDWSRAHPGHLPILILVELKDSAIPGLPTRPVPFDAAQIESVETEIASVFDRAEVFRPDDLRGSAATLPEAIQARGWPTLADLRGKVAFALDNEGPIRDRYLDGHPALQGRAMFATVETPDHPAAAWFKINDPERDFDRIQDLVRRGFLVRTRADADTRHARDNDTRRRDRAFSSGAQFISTDYPEPRVEFSDYCVAFPAGAVARPNPVNAPNPDLPIRENEP